MKEPRKPDMKEFVPGDQLCKCGNIGKKGRCPYAEEMAELDDPNDPNYPNDSNEPPFICNCCDTCRYECSQDV